MRPDSIKQATPPSAAEVLEARRIHLAEQKAAQGNPRTGPNPRPVAPSAPAPRGLTLAQRDAVQRFLKQTQPVPPAHPKAQAPGWQKTMPTGQPAAAPQHSAAPPRVAQPSQSVHTPKQVPNAHFNKFQAGSPTAKPMSPYGSANYNSLKASRATGGGVPGQPPAPAPAKPFTEGVLPEYRIQPHRPAPLQTPPKPAAAGIAANEARYGIQPRHGPAPARPLAAPNPQAQAQAVRPALKSPKFKPGTMGFSPKGLGGGAGANMMMFAAPFSSAIGPYSQGDDLGYGVQPDQIQQGFDYRAVPGDFPDQGGTAPMQYVPRMVRNPRAGETVGGPLM